MPSTPTPQELVQKIKDAKNEASVAKRSIVAIEKSAQQKYSSIEKVAKSVKSKATDTMSELAKDIKLKQNDYNTLVTDSTKEIKQASASTKRDHTKFNATYATAMTGKTGIKARHDQIVDLHSNATKTERAIDKEQAKIQKASDKVADLLKSSKDDRRNIGQINTNAEKVNKAINETYQLTLDTTMSGSLIERRNQLEKTAKRWAIAFLISLGAIVAGVLIVAISIAFSPSDADYIRLIAERLLFITPLIVVALVVSRYYNHERKLYEEYAFKAASAQTIRGYTILLNQEFGNDEHAEERIKILDFTLAVMTGIFNRDSIVQTPTLLHFVLGGSLAKFEARVEDKLDDIAKAVKEEGA